MDRTWVWIELDILKTNNLFYNSKSIKNRVRNNIEKEQKKFQEI